MTPSNRYERTRLLRSVALGVLSCCILACSGCKTTPAPRGPGPVLAPRGKPTAPETVINAQNARVEGLDTLWTRITLRVSGKLANASLNKEEAEGHLQIVLPRKVAIDITKVGNIYFYLGSNDSVYWWLDLTEKKIGYFGRHENARPEAVDRFGVPVQPLDLIELLAITPIKTDPAAARAGERPATHWSTDGTLVWYDLPLGGGSKRVFVDPKSLQPALVELLDSGGKVLIRSELSRYVDFQSRSRPTARPSVPTRCIITVPRTDLTIRINLEDPDGRRPKDVAFDFARLAKDLYPVNQLIDLDKQPEKNGEPEDK